MEMFANFNLNRLLMMMIRDVMLHLFLLKLYPRCAGKCVAITNAIY